MVLFPITRNLCWFICLSITLTINETHQQQMGDAGGAGGGGGKEEATYDAKRPNIVFIVAEDLGWDDIALHGSKQIQTPTMDDLARSGVLLNSYYVSPSPFATRVEIMTGKYATKLGVQHGIFHNKQPSGLPENEKILPEYLKDLGYSTHAVGKWGLGFYKEKMLPWKRGFDTFYGGLTSSTCDYYTHSAFNEDYGLDLRSNEEVVHNETGKYATELYTEQAVDIINTYSEEKPFFLYVSHQAVHSGNLYDPLQVPDRYLNNLKYIKDPKRQKFAGMVNALDESILNISIALSDRGFMSNTVVIFTSLSGGAVGGMELSMGSNYPLRGSKMTLWEGGLRTVAFLVSDLINDTSFVNEELFHSTDWLPTILHLATAGEDMPDVIPQLDGYNTWDSMTHKKTISPRFEILHQFDPIQNNQCALRVGDYKIIVNQDIGYYGDWFPRPSEIDELKNRTEPKNTMSNAKIRCDKNYPHPFLQMHAPPCDPMKKPCLFNIQWDPCEFHNLASFMPNTLKVLRDRLNYYHRVVKKPSYPALDNAADPENYGGVWGPWKGLIQANATQQNDTTQQEDNSPHGNETSQQSVNAPVPSSNYPGVLVPTSSSLNHSTLQSGFGDQGSYINTTASPVLQQINHTTVYPESIYPDPSLLIGGTRNTTDSTTTTPAPPTPIDHSNKTADLAGYLVGHGKEITIAKNGEFATESNTSDTYGVLSENTKAQLNTLGGKLQTNDTEIGLHSKNLEVHQNKSKEAITFGKDLDWMKALDMSTQTTHKENSFVVTGQQFSNDNNGTTSPANQTIPTTSNQTSTEVFDASNHTLGEGPEHQVNGGPGQSTSNNETSTNYIPTISASIAPSTDLSNVVPQAKADHESASQRNGNKTEFVGTENGSETYSESEAGGQVMNKINSNSTGIKDAYYNAQLDTVADAGANGPKMMNSTSTMTSGGKINTDKIPAASEFIPKPQYTKVEKPAMARPTNDVINPLQVNDTAFDSSQAAGAGAGAGAGAESLTEVGSLADTMASIGQNHTEASTKTLDSDGGLLQVKGNQTVSMYPQEMGGGMTNPTFPNRTKSGTEIFITDDMRSGTGTSTEAGSTSESQVGSFGGSGSKVASNQTSPSQNKTSPANTASGVTEEAIKIGGSKHAGHMTLVSPGATNQRVFQSVSDVISDSSMPQLCPDGRDCINKPITNENIITSTNATTGATSNGKSNAQPVGGKDGGEDNKFNGTVWFHNKKFAIVGTANEIDKIGSPPEKEASSVKNDHIPEQPSKPLLIPSPVPMKKQNIGFNVMLPSTFIKQLANIPKFKEVESSLQSTIGRKSQEQLSFIRRPRPKAAIKKVLDMITDPTRTRKANVPVPHVSDILSSAIHEPDTVEMMAMDTKEGDMGDMGAVKPVSRDTVLEVPAQKSEQRNQTSDSTINANTASNIQHQATSSETSGDLGSIVTLVGKSNSKRTKQNDSTNAIDDNNAQKKTMESSEHLALKHTQHNTSSSGETNAANVNQVSGPSNSIIVSSVIVVLIAAFVVVGMAVVAVVAVVARHCNLGKHLQTAS